VNREEKQAQVAALRESFSASSVLIVTHYSGLSVADITELRKNLRALGANFKVTKNSLTQLALKGTQYEHLSEHFTGPTAVAYSDDVVAAAKGVVEFANDNEKLVILGGAMNEEALDIDSVKKLAKLPSIDELRAKIVGMINTPATRIAGVVQAPAGQVARVVGAYSQSQQ
jgi:large subunit ribosomal protein L10